MVEVNRLVAPPVREHLGETERSYLHSVFERYQGYPSLQQLWQLMDEQWHDHGCDPLQMDGRVTAFYRDPVWLLNGLFIEQDPQSLAIRQAFTAWVMEQAPARVADFGGGFGGLARFIGTALPQASVEVVEPHPHPAAMALAADTPNVRFVSELTGDYDLLVATDVFEHVPDPIALAASTASHLRIGGRYLIANCFAPVIACHLPQLFHLSIGWDQAMRGMGLQPREKVKYGRAYGRTGDLDEEAAKRAEILARWVYPWVKSLPKGRTHAGRALMRLMSAMPAR
ncbi:MULTISPECIES: bifunctional 2-polyprenyl-6-hydroxyphenol methylase/3-demethylubiquinol 3-O-methyltransferase UbiG [unclassified Cyanobium]|uniref:class I SAM-dependent methyltransferase n=1 Tax=unclassified Cyanobium TaxID=2627006 RepID=UPI0020CEEECE|nr:MULTISPECIES: class I SAM-dependent methyltransferase [unclassified Cyanobium]MCP9776963.1 class I SAM-dependent methyltransferase [Cyanobium sp. Tous-M-B4]MCP9875229.1 class I SAM-dependent methyltransferase [Cyanobium sp. A2C-AMD]